MGRVILRLMASARYAFLGGAAPSRIAQTRSQVQVCGAASSSPAECRYPGAAHEVSDLGQHDKFAALIRPGGRKANAGFSMVEMAVSVAVLLVLAAISVPALTRAFAIYQLNDTAARLAGTLKFARFEAIRLNRPVDCQIQQVGIGWLVYADTNRNQTPDQGETQDAIVGQAGLIGAGGGVPDPSPIAAKLGGSGYPLTPISGTNTFITFDSRGAVTTGGNATVYILYLGNTGNPDLGYRAVVLLPSGMVHVWTAPSGGTWSQVS
jgi:prepilin-type N-terminal cleavage/methylation domain-containing protein